MASPGTLSGNAQQVGDLMYHLLQMKAEQLPTQAQAQTSTLKLSGHLAAAAVHSNALQPWQRQGAETDGAAENMGVVLAVWRPPCFLPLSSLLSLLWIKWDSLSVLLPTASVSSCSWNFSPFMTGHLYCFLSGFDLSLQPVLLQFWLISTLLTWWSSIVPTGFCCSRGRWV